MNTLYTYPTPEVLVEVFNNIGLYENRDFIRNYNIGNYSVDFYFINLKVNNRNIAIDFLPVKTQNVGYNSNKKKECLQNNIDVLSIYSYNWNYSFAPIRHNLYLLLSPKKIDENNLSIKEINTKSAQMFCERYNMMGYKNCSIKIGLVTNDNTLVSLMLFKKLSSFNNKENYEYEMCRFNSTTYIENDEIKKLFNFFIQNYNPKSIKAYTQFDWINDNLYQNIGFKYKGLTDKENYFWIRKNEIADRRSSQLKHETQQMENAGWTRVYTNLSLKYDWHSNI